MKKITCMLLLIHVGFMMAQTKTVVTQNGEKLTISPLANNGLTQNSGYTQLGGALTKASVLTTTSAYTLAIAGLQAGNTSDNVLVSDANGVLRYVLRSSFGGNDNLGDHTATMDLKMSGKNINNAANITATGKTSTQTAQIAKGTDGSTPTAGYIATAVDGSGNIAWKAPAGSATEWYVANTTTDAGADKNNGMYRNGRVGIGVSNPTTLLDINNGNTNGAIKITDGTQGNGKILTSDSNGLATWQTKGPQTTQGSVPYTTQTWNPSLGLFYSGFSIQVPTGRSTITAGIIVIATAEGYATARLSTSSSSFIQPSGVAPNYSGFTLGSSTSAGQVTWYANNTTGSPQTYYMWLTSGGATKGTTSAQLGGTSVFAETFIMVAY